MKSELLVIADQHAAVNAFPGLVHTARHTTRVVCTRIVTRYPYENVRMDHLLSRENNLSRENKNLI